MKNLEDEEEEEEEALCKRCGEKVRLLAGSELVQLFRPLSHQTQTEEDEALRWSSNREEEGGAGVPKLCGFIHKKRLGLCCVFRFPPTETTLFSDNRYPLKEKTPGPSLGSSSDLKQREPSVL